MEILASVEAAIVGNAVDGPVRMVPEHALGPFYAEAGDQRGQFAVF